jgi:hypothetical protein
MCLSGGTRAATAGRWGPGSPARVPTWRASIDTREKGTVAVEHEFF